MKPLTTLFTALVLSTALIGCGNDSDSDSDENRSNNEDTPTSETISNITAEPAPGPYPTPGAAFESAYRLDFHGTNHAQITGYLEERDIHYYAVAVNVGDLLVYTESGIDTVGAVFNGDYSCALTNDDTSKVEFDFQISGYVNQEGIAYITVAGYRSEQIGEYTLHVFNPAYFPENAMTGQAFQPIGGKAVLSVQFPEEAFSK